MPAGASSVPELQSAKTGWWFRRWAGHHVAAGITDRQTDCSRMIGSLGVAVSAVAGEQVHGASLAVVEGREEGTRSIPGCDALLTHLSGVALLARTADCLPIFFADPARGVIGIAHAGWRGLAASLPARVVSAFRHVYHTSADELRVAIGPAIRACCYEVGPEFVARFGSFVQTRKGRRTCDLIGVARAQLERCGVRPERVTESARCTACERHNPAIGPPPSALLRKAKQKGVGPRECLVGGVGGVSPHAGRGRTVLSPGFDSQSEASGVGLQWFSLRREGPSTGRMTSLIMMRP